MYHEKCLREFWGSSEMPQLDYDSTQLDEMAKEWAMQRVSVTGVQPKFSLGRKNAEKQGSRLTVMSALDGNFILKPPFAEYPEMPEIEALCMVLARQSGISTVPSILIPLKDGQLAYLTKRIDRTASGKLAMEDMCQLSEKPTELKYRGSHEQIAKIIAAHSRDKLLNVLRFYEMVLFSFLIGNNDMHLKNFSLVEKNGGYALSPAYDLLAAQLLLPEDVEEFALTLNGKKRKLKRQDFEAAMLAQNIPKNGIENMFERMEKASLGWVDFIESSFLSQEKKVGFLELVANRKRQVF